MKTSSGKKWARFGLGFGAVFSVAGNITHTVMLESGVPLWLRVPFAAIWPGLLFVGIEVLVRVDWRRNFIDHAGRALLWGPVGIVAAVVSYVHLFGLMMLAAEGLFASAIGPLAIDGLMIGCTVALLAIRAQEMTSDVTENMLRLEALHADQEMETLERTEQERIAEEFAEELKALPETPEPPARETRTRAPRGEIAPEQKQAMEELLSGKTPAEITIVSRATAGRIAKVIRTLRDNPHAVIDSRVEKVHPTLVGMIRAEVRQGASW